ncbi:hypothetical protein BGX30_010450 [Mortierella sp. GBA39]|nr:hypothetical protein BGX30_010450 [Mortierella sp. GBA39]
MSEAKQVQNLPPTVITTLPDGTIRISQKDIAYMVAQYAYAIWLVLMALKAIVGFRANFKFNLRWMGIYNVLFGLDTAFEFVHTTLGIIFQDLGSMDDSEIIRHYAINFLILVVQCYGFFCVWMHRKWVITEMPQLINPEGPPMTFLRLMVPWAYSRSSPSSGNNRESTAGTTSETRETGSGTGTGVAVDPRTLEEGTATALAIAPTPPPTTTTTTTTESRH